MQAGSQFILATISRSVRNCHMATHTKRCHLRSPAIPRGRGDTWSVRARFSTGRARSSGGFRLACGLKSARETFVARKPRTTPMDTRNKSHPRPKLSRLAVYRGAHTVIHRLACAWWSESAPSARWLVPKGVLGGSSGSPETPPARPGLLVLSQMQRTRPLSPPCHGPLAGRGARTWDRFAPWAPSQRHGGSGNTRPVPQRGRRGTPHSTRAAPQGRRYSQGRVRQSRTSASGEVLVRRFIRLFPMEPSTTAAT